MAEIHKLYDQQQRIEIEYAGCRREVTAAHHPPDRNAGQLGTVIYSQLDETNADASDP